MMDNFLFRSLVWKGNIHLFVHTPYLLGVYYGSGPVPVTGEIH